MVESAFAFDGIMIIMETIALLKKSFDIMIELTITAMGVLDDRFGAGLLCLMWRTSL